MGVGEAGCNPAGYSLIGDYFESRRRATALSIYQMGGYAGGFAGLMLGGAIALVRLNLVGVKGFEPAAQDVAD